MNNVFIKHRRRGKLVEVREAHNSWSNHGRQFLRDIVTSVSETRRLKYASLGIGSNAQSRDMILPAVDSTHTPGYDPRATTGGTYTHLDLEAAGDGSVPAVSTLEMPARVSGVEEDYPDAILSGTSTWYIQPPDLYITQLSSRRGIAVHFFVDATAGQYVFGSYTMMPISEAGLHLGDVTVTQPYQPLVAYVNFATLLLDVDSEVEFIWLVKVAP